MLLQLLVLSHVRLESLCDLVNFSGCLHLKLLDITLRATTLTRLLLQDLILTFELLVLIPVPLDKSLYVSLKFVDLMLLARGEISAFGLGIAKLLLQCADLGLTFVHFFDFLLISLEQLVLHTSHFSLQVKYLTSGIGSHTSTAHC